ncbi:MAG: PilZ domain-containing protein [Firmicutes bacterium HGW-Firmicutes-3]|nr:MAG: PilZ domain-containing protein [Firmicutes bacterium HGW-Firmicutes-3]
MKRRSQMEERRKNKRLPIRLELAINELFRQDHEIIPMANKEIHVINISRTGIGFECESELPLGYYFDARIDFDQQNYFYCVVKIVRKVDYDGTNLYGCEFVGLAEFLSKKVDEYQATVEQNIE